MRLEMRQRVGRQSADTEPLVFPRQKILRQIYLLMHHVQLHVRVELAQNLLHVLRKKTQNSQHEHNIIYEQATPTPGDWNEFDLCDNAA